MSVNNLALHFRRIITALLLGTLLVLYSGCSLFGSDTPEVKQIIQAPTRGEDELLASALEAYDRQFYTLAKDTFTELRDGYPGSYYATFAELKIADCHFELEDYEAAVVAYEEFLRIHPGHEDVAYIRYQIARSHEKQYRGPTHDQNPLHEAISCYRQLLKEHPASKYAIRARRSIDRCRETLAEHEAFVARFYWKLGQRKAAAQRYKTLLGLFRDSQAAHSGLAEIEEEFGGREKLLALAEEKPFSEEYKEKGLPEAPVLLPPHEPFQQERPDLSEELQAASAREEKRPRTPHLVIAARSTEEYITGLIVRLNCEQLENNIGVFTTTLSGPVLFFSQPAADSTKKSSGQFTAQLKAKSAYVASSVHADSPESYSCDTGRSRLTLTKKLTDEPASDNVGYALDLSVPSDATISFMQLDRPHRFVALVDEISKQEH